MSTRRLIPVVLAGLAALSVQGTVWAQPAGKQPCRADIEKLCKGLPQGGGRLRECLKQHASELSAGCKEKMDTGQGIFAQPGGGNAAATMMEICGDDMKKVCPKVEAGGGRIRQCLKEHLSELSPKCKALIQESSQGARRRAGGFRVACRGDLDKLCRGTEPGGGRLMDCLKKHDAELSAGCRTALGEVTTGTDKPKPK